MMVQAVESMVVTPVVLPLLELVVGLRAIPVASPLVVAWMETLVAVPMGLAHQVSTVEGSSAEQVPLFIQLLLSK